MGSIYRSDWRLRRARKHRCNWRVRHILYGTNRRVYDWGHGIHGASRCNGGAVHNCGTDRSHRSFIHHRRADGIHRCNGSFVHSRGTYGVHRCNGSVLNCDRSHGMHRTDWRKLHGDRTDRKGRDRWN